MAPHGLLPEARLMCGICGVIGGDVVRERERVRAMADAIAHRGPDDEGFHGDDMACLGNRRLAIIDLDHGHQPIASEDGSLWITFNGEIYNHAELRSDLETDGMRFRTRTDTEVLVNLVLARGPAALHRLRGMFAFAIWDRRHERLFAARDPFGQKPFFYSVLGDRFLFASEIKSLLAHGDVPSVPEHAAVDYYLAQRFIPPPLTMIRGIRKLPAGHWLEWHSGEVRVERYWEPEFPQGAARSDADWIEELAVRLDDAVRAHMVSDVPVGGLLSGGIDSSAVVAAMIRQSSERIRTFCVGSDVDGFDERPHARRVARHLGTTHEERSVGHELLRGLPRLVRCMDEPSDPIAACQYEAAALAAPHVKVVLGGDGGDEIFAGFDRYAAFRWVERYAALPAWLRERVFGPALRRVPNPFGYKSVGQRARWLADVAAERGGRGYARMTSHFRFSPEDKAWLYGPALSGMLTAQDTLEALAEPFARAPTADTLHRMLYADMVTRLPEHSLQLTDRMSMAHGLEARSPLLDPELAAFCASMPSHLKIRRGTTKYAMRAAARRWLPDDIVRRPKQGFMFPVAYWLNDATLDDVAAKLRDGALTREGWITGAGVDRLVSEHRGRRADHHVRIWMLLSLEVWHRIYLDGEPVRDDLPPAISAPMHEPQESMTR
jgi:asparagine synthase (glutamine-hydrolysing)